MKVGIIGLGLMGGSIAKGLKLFDKTIEIVAFDTNTSDLELALKENIIDKYTNKIDSTFADTDYIFICIPVKYIFNIAKELESIVSDNCLICDIGSTKKTIVTDCEKLNINYIGTHPMVGKEKSGFTAADSHLYDNAYFIVTKTENTDEENINRICEVIKMLKAKPYVIPLEKHDFIVSVISHIPHIVAYSLVGMTNSLEDENNFLRTLAAGGFKDITRIASSSPEMWESICLENNDEILSTLSHFKNSLNEIETYIKNKDVDSMHNFFKTSKDFRDSVDTIKKANEIDTKITNTPGELKKIISVLADNNLNIINLSIQDDVDEKHGMLKLFFENIEKKEKAYEILKKEGMIN